MISFLISPQAIAIIPISQQDLHEEIFTPKIHTSSSNNILSYSYTFQSPMITKSTIQNTTFSKVIIDNCSTLHHAHHPMIPYKKIYLLLPPNSIVDSVDVNASAETIALNSPLLPNYPSFESEQDQQISVFQPPYFPLDSSVDTTPRQHVEIIGTGSYRGYSIVMLHLYPIIYDYIANTVDFSSTISFSLRLLSVEINHELLRDSQVDREAVVQKIDNPSIISSYEAVSVFPGQTSPLDSSKYNYIIITNRDLEENFKPLIQYKQEYLSSRIINLTYISQQFSGRDLAEKIRTFIKYAYQHWETEFVLLGGDVSIVPYRGLWGHALDHNNETLHDEQIPGDVYFAGLDGTWDADGDFIFGEDAGNSTKEEADFFADVYVGRAPVENGAEVGTFINKVITYETSEKPTNILLHQSGLNTRNDPDSTVIPERCARWVPPTYTIEKLYQVNELITPEKWMNAFSEDKFLVEHTGNGEILRYYIYWPTTTFDTYESFSRLQNHFFPIHTSVACKSGSFEYEEDCIGETLILNPYGGASACLFNSRNGFTSLTDAHAYSGEIIEQQFRFIFQKPNPQLGIIHQNAKDYFASNAQYDPAYRWCYYTLNLLGDPEMPVLDKREDYINSAVFYVDDDYDEETDGWLTTRFSTIQNAIDAAENWDKIYVSSGTYYENILIDKTLEIIGESKRTTVIDNGNVRISGNRVKLHGFTIKNIDYPSISRIIILNSDYISISNCIISDSDIGIYISDSRNVFISQNQFLKNLYSVFSTVTNGDIYIYDNEFSLDVIDGYGINAQSNGHLFIENNTFTSVLDFYNFSCAIYSQADTDIISNTITDCTIGIWVEGGTHQIEYNSLEHNRHIGIYSAYATLDISYNTIVENGNNFIIYQYPFQPGGIIINDDNEESCTIRFNSIMDNKGYGVFIENLVGLQHRISKNDFIDNSRDARLLNSYVNWKGNYWGQRWNIPHLIFGRYQINVILYIPVIQIDFLPSEIPVTLQFE